MSGNGDQSFDVEAAKKVILNPEGRLPNCLIIDDPLIESPGSELQAKIEEWWDKTLQKRSDGKEIVIKSRRIDVSDLTSR